MSDAEFVIRLGRKVLDALEAVGQRAADPMAVREKVCLVGADHLRHGWTREAVERWAFRHHGPDLRAPCRHESPGNCERCGAVLRRVTLWAKAAGLHVATDYGAGPWELVSPENAKRLRQAPDVHVPTRPLEQSTVWISTGLWRRLFAGPPGEVPITDDEAGEIADAALDAYKAVRKLRKPLQLEALDIARRIAREVNR